MPKVNPEPNLIDSGYVTRGEQAKWQNRLESLEEENQMLTQENEKLRKDLGQTITRGQILESKIARMEARKKAAGEARLALIEISGLGEVEVVLNGVWNLGDPKHVWPVFVKQIQLKQYQTYRELEEKLKLNDPERKQDDDTAKPTERNKQSR